MTEIPKKVFDGLLAAFVTDDDTLMRIIVFLTQRLDDGSATPYITSLKRIVRRPALFKIVAEKLVEDIKTAENDEHFRQVMYDIWHNFMKENTSEHPDDGQRWAMEASGGLAVVPSNVLSCLRKLPQERYLALQQVVKNIGRGNSVVARYMNKALAAKSAGSVVKVGLVVVILAYDVIINIKRWWNGKISGKRCVKNILDCGMSCAAGVTGGVIGEMIGASAGSLVGPIGTVVGALAGATFGTVFTAFGAQTLSDRLTQWIFGLPKMEALENAYIYFGVPPNAPNSTINTIYRKLALKHHPDKGGDIEQWLRLQYSLAVIREARGE